MLLFPLADSKMADTIVFVAVVIAIIAAVVSMSGTLLFYYFCCRNRCTTVKNLQEMEPLQTKLSIVHTEKDKLPISAEASEHRDDVKKLTRHNVEDRLQKQASINIVSPTLKTKPVPSVLPISLYCFSLNPKKSLNQA